MIENYLKELAKYLEIRFPISEISKKTGYSESTVSNYYNNKLKISKSFIHTLEKTFNIDYEKFVKLQENAPNKIDIISEDIVFYKKINKNDTNTIQKELLELLEKAENYLLDLKEKPTTSEILKEIFETELLIKKIKDAL